MVKYTHVIVKHKHTGKVKVIPRSRYSVRQKTLGWGAVGLLAGGLPGALIGAVGYSALRKRR
jgi:hypothetical protein